jgi:hypothetical protein
MSLAHSQLQPALAKTLDIALAAEIASYFSETTSSHTRDQVSGCAATN